MLSYESDSDSVVYVGSVSAPDDDVIIVSCNSGSGQAVMPAQTAAQRRRVTRALADAVVTAPAPAPAVPRILFQLGAGGMEPAYRFFFDEPSITLFGHSGGVVAAVVKLLSILQLPADAKMQAGALSAAFKRSVQELHDATSASARRHACVRVNIFRIDEASGE